ncbi:hypothetical protein ON010_g4308 [Phytophthora cinnamomi]|nr:hypothetical protein ON010_g4308 [Phytophthora cinnamomi]
MFFEQVGYDDLFGNPNWNTWTKYVDDFNVLHPAKKTSVYGELAKHFSEEKLISMVGSAKAVPSTKSVAFKVESEQCRAWLDRRLSPKDVFKGKFKLGTAGDKLFNDPHLITWVNYVDDWNKTYDGNTLVTSILTQYYSDRTLSAILEAAKLNPETKNLALRVQGQHFRGWLNANKSPDNVYYNVLHITPTNNLLEDPVFHTWLTYISYYNSKKPRKTSWMDSWLQKMLDKDVWLIVKVGETSERTKYLATYFEAALYNKYITENFAPKTVSSKLHLGTSDKDQEFLKRYTSAFKSKNMDTA